MERMSVRATALAFEYVAAGAIQPVKWLFAGARAFVLGHCHRPFSGLDLRRHSDPLVGSAPHR
jgi:hypothetical protein